MIPGGFMRPCREQAIAATVTSDTLRNTDISILASLSVCKTPHYEGKERETLVVNFMLLRDSSSSIFYKRSKLLKDKIVTIVK